MSKDGAYPCSTKPLKTLSKAKNGIALPNTSLFCLRVIDKGLSLLIAIPGVVYKNFYPFIGSGAK